ncbi:type IV toxin-antitoxin system AbiEi family antitoxin domain-containing protein [Enterococcus gallinarum]|uniref:type IV toxin-antitoxin system AbiEi family antitoxin domain-containing protein n=1 Tax=Enterococcus gallinarum TaxID=1353 RepID=UPI00214B5E24|nr:type IV toxin-antitoxin system AbiEi family antitoxin domain-containing protein [Enterococcus gallinarum]MCR1929411.1 type IV toxin-antitoxin system AbiEi family antitoxin domain-containing protein [Enterococcus gallinarum]MCR1932297.1 type IV toxin-antitoxin system AbiEi family antitoxin domain-containing protein [Enterococcus gallinarum]
MKKVVYELLKQYNGTLAMKDAKKAGVSPVTIKRMVDHGELDREYPGFFTLPGQFADELLIAQKKYERGIISHITALDLYDLTDMIPRKIDMTVPYGYHVSEKGLTEFAVDLHFTKPEYYSVGRTEVKSRYGNTLVAYDVERTLCDIWNPWYKVTDEIRIKAIKYYMNSKERNLIKLRMYQRILPVDKEMRSYIMALH